MVTGSQVRLGRKAAKVVVRASANRTSRAWYWLFIESIGAASFSIYLLHTFVVFDFAFIAKGYLPAMTTWEISETIAAVVLAAVFPVAWLSYRFLEMPLLRFRTEYVRRPESERI